MFDLTKLRFYLGTSLLSAFTALFTLACTLHVFTCIPATVVSLEELGSLVECLELLALFGLFLVHDSFKVVALSALILTLLPLVTNLTQLVLGILTVSLRLALLLSLLTHLCIV